MKYKPEKVNKRNRTLDSCKHGDCEDHIIWDYEACWEHLTETEQKNLKERLKQLLRKQKDLKGIVLTGADLTGFDFRDVDLSYAFMDKTKCKKADFSEANLEATYFGWADLTEATFARTNLGGTVFSIARLHNAYITATSISHGRKPINLKHNSFRKYWIYGSAKVNETVNKGAAKATYQALKSLFTANGDYDSASWAAFKEKVLERKTFWEDKRYIKWFNSFIFGAFCGYGEKPFRVILFSIFLIMIYSAAYFNLDLLTDKSDTYISNWWDSIYFSLCTFCTVSYGDIIPNSNLTSRMISASESFVGLFTTGLFIFTLSRRFVAR